MTSARRRVYTPLLRAIPPTESEYVDLRGVQCSIVDRVRSRRPVAYEIVHEIEGRIRLRVPALAGDPSLGERTVSFLQRQPGVAAARVNAGSRSIVVTFDPTRVLTEQIVAWVQHDIPRVRASTSRAFGRPAPAALVCGGLALGLSLLGAPVALTIGLAGISAVPIFTRAMRNILRKRRVTVDALDATAITVLALRGDLFAASLTVALIAGGEYIRTLTARRSRSALVGLLASSASFAWVVRGRHRERLPADTLTAGDTVVVYPGELVAVDGVVIRGRALVDQKMLTGESTPVLRQAGDLVYAATVLTDGKLYVRTERTGGATRAQQIVQILEGSPTHDTRIGNYAGRYADRMVLPTMAAAGAIYVLTQNVARAISVLVFDFATGIRVATPTTILAAMAAAVRQDVLVKGGRALEQLARVDTVVFDKTGTLTSGSPRVTAIYALLPDVDENTVLALAAAAEQRLTHPAAQAIVEAATTRALLIPDREDATFTIGLGVAATVDRHKVLVGGVRFLAQEGIRLPDVVAVLQERHGRAGASVVIVARDDAVIGLIAYADVARPEVSAVLRRLRDRGVQRLIMVTGDNARVAEAMARQVGIDQVEADVFPERKAAIVRELQAAGHVVLVIGDGINDSPALAYADVSVSLKAGSEVARETADVVLHGDLHGLPEAIDLAREAMRLVRQNIAVVVVPNAIGMLLAGLGVIGPVAATAINNGSTVAAGLNGLRPLLTDRSAGERSIAGPSDRVDGKETQRHRRTGQPVIRAQIPASG